MPQRTVLLIGSDDLLWCSLRAVLRSLGEVEVSADLADPQQALTHARTCHPDAVLLQLIDDALDASVRSLLGELRATCPRTSSIVVAPAVRPEAFLALVGLGIRGCLYWRDLDACTLRTCLDAVLGAELTVASRSVPMELLTPQHRRAEVSLTGREQLVLNALAEGLTQPAIAKSCRLSVRTVKRTVASLEAKLDAPSPFVLGLKASAFRLVPPIS